MVIAPCTANTLGKLAHGIADNLLTITALAIRCPLLIAPAMDVGIYTNPATQDNVRILTERGVYFAGPDEGRMASGLVGKGRLVEPAELLGQLRLVLGRQGPLAGKKIVVTAGGTQEPLDPVRVLTNKSSGKQGYALAQAALDAGGNVSLVSAPTALPAPVGARFIPVSTAQAMLETVLAESDRGGCPHHGRGGGRFPPEAGCRKQAQETGWNSTDRVGGRAGYPCSGGSHGIRSGRAW